MCWVLGRQRGKLLQEPPCFCFSPRWRGGGLAAGVPWRGAGLCCHCCQAWSSLGTKPGVSPGGLDQTHAGSDWQGHGGEHGGCLYALILKPCWEKQCSGVYSPVSSQYCTLTSEFDLSRWMTREPISEHLTCCVPHFPSHSDTPCNLCSYYTSAVTQFPDLFLFQKLVLKGIAVMEGLE